MKIKNFQLFYLILLLAPLQCFDFIPNWTIFCFSALIFLRLFISLPQLVILPLMLAASFYLLKDFGFKLQPESAVGILNFMILAKILQRTDHYKNYYIIGFLWIGTFALFNTNIYYLLYLIFSLIFIFNLIPNIATEPFRFNNIKLNKKSFLNILKALPLIGVLFFVFPRFHGFFPSANNQSIGKIGYATKVNNSTFEGLSTNSQIAFYAEMKNKIDSSLLYWRGRVLTYTDGYNWSSQSGHILRKPLKITHYKNSFMYNIKFEQSFEGDIILLDTPYAILKSSLNFYEEKQYKTYKAYNKKKKIQISAQSVLNSSIIQKGKISKKYLQIPKFIPKKLREINQQIQNKNPNKLIKEFDKYLKKNNFKYSLNPGRMGVMNDFLEKKLGYCTHFASLLGIILRMNGIPSRLVSGFQGGIYNSVGEFYTISSNDAHAWVEYYQDNKWIRVDPTQFVSPLRIIQGGQNFLTQSNVIESSSTFDRNFLAIKNYFNNVNYKLSLFMDNFDRSAQDELAKNFNLSLKRFYLYGLICLILIMTIIFFFNKRVKRVRHEPIDKYFLKFQKKCKNQGLVIQGHQTPSEIINDIEKYQLDHEYIEFIQLYAKVKYGQDKSISSLKNIIQKI